jgi:ketosteroid isomerase-like protein
MHEDLEVVSEDGDVVVASCHLRAHLIGQPDGPEVTFDYALRVTFAGGLIAVIDIYEDAAAATAA